MRAAAAGPAQNGPERKMDAIRPSVVPMPEFSISTPSSFSHHSFALEEFRAHREDARDAKAAESAARATTTSLFASVTGRARGSTDVKKRITTLPAPVEFAGQYIRTVHFPKPPRPFDGFAIVTCASGISFKGVMFTISTLTPLRIVCDRREDTENNMTTFLVRSCIEDVPAAPPSASVVASPHDSVFHDDAKYRSLLAQTALPPERIAEMELVPPRDRQAALSKIDPRILGPVCTRHVMQREYAELHQAIGSEHVYALRPDQAHAMVRMLRSERWKLCVRACFRHIVEMVNRGTTPFPEMNPQRCCPATEDNPISVIEWEQCVTWLRARERDMLGGGPTEFRLTPQVRKRAQFLAGLGMVRMCGGGGGDAVAFEYVARECARIKGNIAHFSSLRPPRSACARATSSAPLEMGSMEEDAILEQLLGGPDLGDPAAGADELAMLMGGDFDADADANALGDYGAFEMETYSPPSPPPAAAAAAPKALHDEQKAALVVMSGCGVSLLAAPAGTGKTHTIGMLPSSMATRWGDGKDESGGEGETVAEALGMDGDGSSPKKRRRGAKKGGRGRGRAAALPAGRVLIVCATGQAAKNAAAKTGIKSSTIHSLIHHVWTYVAVRVAMGRPRVSIREAKGGFLAALPVEMKDCEVARFLRAADPVVDREMLDWSASEGVTEAMWARFEKGKLEKWAAVRHLVVDEYTLVSQTLLDRLLQVARHMMPCVTVTFCGDPGQVGSVGYGSVSHDLMACAAIPQARLQVNHRQDPSARRLTDICHCVYFERPLPPAESIQCDSFRIVPCDARDKEAMGKAVRDLFSSAEHGPRVRDLGSSQFLAYLNETVDSLNSHISSLVFGTSVGAARFIRAGAKIMFTRNTNFAQFGSDCKMNGSICTVERCEYTLAGPLNMLVSSLGGGSGSGSGGGGGSGGGKRPRNQQQQQQHYQARIAAEHGAGGAAILNKVKWIECESVSPSKHILHRIHLSDGTYVFEKDIPIDTIKPAYAVTVTKYQGSESDYIFLWLDGKPGGGAGGGGGGTSSSPLNSRVLYSALTRARKGVVVLGSYDRLCSAASNRTKPQGSHLARVLAT